MAVAPIPDELRAFRYVTACDQDYVPVYRAIVQLFFDAKQRYIIELHTFDILQALHRLGYTTMVPGEQELEQRLCKLVEWGNLSATFDTAEVRRLADFYRRRQIYSLTTVGEAAHRAVLQVEATIGKSGSLQKAMLARIHDVLYELAKEAERLLPDPIKLYNLLHDLQAAFGTLTEEANYFLTQLRDQTEKAERMEEQSFLRYKRALVEYISGFVEDLRRYAGKITQGIIVVEQRDVAGKDRLIDLFSLAAGGAALPPEPDGRSPQERWVADQEARWAGVRTWFVPGSGEATVDRLANRACEAVVKLTRVLARLDERKIQRLDRAADFRCLARWFAACPDATAAHRLFGAAFGLYPARHFHLAEEDAELHRSATSWWDAKPVIVPRRLRTHGNVSSAGRPAPVADYSAHRRWLADLQRRERERVAAVYQRFVHRPFRLGALPLLTELEFDVLLGWLAEAFAVSHGKVLSWSVRTVDGQHIIEVTPQRPETEVIVRTPRGELHCLDYLVQVLDAEEIAVQAQIVSAS